VAIGEGGDTRPVRHVREVVRDLVRHPVRMLVRRWNWKTALLSALLRGTIFFASTISEGLRPAAAALGRDVLFRVPLGGFYGAVGQAFSSARPVWASYLIVMVIVPAMAHVAEFLVHWTGGTPHLGRAITASVTFSAFSALFNLFLMRRGALLVAGAGDGFGADMRRMPRLLGDFLAVLPRMVLRGLRSASRRR
jgi:hypothetical protein